MNPYDPPEKVADQNVGRPRWFRRFLILNGILLAIPVSIILMILGSLWLQHQMRSGVGGGRSAAYDVEFTGISGPAWPFFIYMMVPNLIMLMYFIQFRKTGTGK